MIVGSGTPQQARVFRDQERVDTLVTDPTLAAYTLAGMKRGVLKTVGPKSLVHAVRALREGHRQKGTAGDPWQQGGVLVVSSLNDGGRELYHHAASEAGDPTDFTAVVRAFDQLARGA